MNTNVNAIGARDGSIATVLEIIILLGSDLMRTDGLRVVSAWRNLPKIVAQPEVESPGDQFCIDLQAKVRVDLGGRAVDGFDAYWSYAPYVELRRRLGNEWPVEALTAYLNIFKWSEITAQQIWQRAVRRYDDLKFFDGRPLLAA